MINKFGTFREGINPSPTVRTQTCAVSGRTLVGDQHSGINNHPKTIKTSTLPLITLPIPPNGGRVLQPATTATTLNLRSPSSDHISPITIVNPPFTFHHSFPSDHLPLATYPAGRRKTKSIATKPLTLGACRDLQVRGKTRKILRNLWFSIFLGCRLPC